MEKLRVRLIGINTPNAVIKTIHRCTLLNARELENSFTKEHLTGMFPRGSGLHLDFSNRGQIILRPEKEISVYLDDVRMVIDQHYPIEKIGVKKIRIGETEFRFHVFSSHF